MLNIMSNIVDFLIRYKHKKRTKELINKGILNIGKHTYFSSSIQVDVYAGSEAKVIIGKYCSIGPDLRIITGGIHPTEWISTFPFRSKWNLPGKFKDGSPSTNGDIIIGNDVWIGTRVTILSGVTIGHGAVIATGAVVANDVEPYNIVGGVPARVLKQRFSVDKTNELLEMAWWNWDEQKIKENIDYLNSILK